MDAPKDIPAGYRLLIGRPRTIVRLDDIIKVRGAGNYCTVRFVDGTRKKFGLTIGQMERRLPEFVRIHRQFLVNPKYVQTVRRVYVEGHRSGVIVLTTGEVLPIARRRKHQVRIAIKHYKNGSKP